MKNHNFRIALALCSVLTFFACEKDKTTQTQPATAQQQWPAKKISSIVHRIGTLDYMTFDFSWTDDFLTEIRYSFYDGSYLGRTVLEYKDGRLDCVYPYDKNDVAYPDGAMHYHYDANGRLVKQNFLLPIRQDNNLCQNTYDDAVPCELTYSYTTDGKVSNVIAIKTLDDGGTESVTYNLTWGGDNVTAITRISADGSTSPLFSGMQYDDKPNPMAFPMGIETMGTDMIMEGVWGNAYIFLAYAFSWSANNMTTLISGNGHCSLTYDEDGFLLSKTITASGQTSTYTFNYCNQ